MRVGIAAVVNNERNIIAEWIAFHAEVGFNHILLYDNCSGDDARDLINYAANFFSVEVIDWPVTDPSFQDTAYEDAARRSSGHLDWLAFIDADEFLYSPKQISVKDVISRHPTAGAVAVNWAMYGSDGHLARPTGLVTENFLRRATNDFGPNRHVKSIVRLSEFRGMQNCHMVKIDSEYVDCLGDPVEWEKDGISLKMSDIEVLRINHYFIRSKEDWTNKIARGYRDQVVRSYTDFEVYDRNDVLDTSAAVIGRRVREKYPFLGTL